MDDKLKKGGRSVLNLMKEGYLADEQQTDSHNRAKDNDVGVNERLYLRFDSKRTTWENNARKCERFRSGYQWTREQINELVRDKKAPIVVNLQNPAVEQLKSMLTSNSPRFNALPREGSDRQTAKAISDIMSYIWQYNRCNVKLKNTVDDYAVKGLGYMAAYWDPYEDFGKGEVIIEDLDPYNVYIDPLSKRRDFSDARHILVVHEWSKEQIMNTFRGIKKSFFKDLPAIAKSDKQERVLHDEADLEQKADDEPEYYRVIDRYTKRMLDMCHYQSGEYEYVIEKENASIYKETVIFGTTTVDLQSGDTNIEYAIEADERGMVLEAMKSLGVHYHIIMEQDPQTGEEYPVPVPGPPSPQAIAEVTIERMTISELISRGEMIETEYPGREIYRVLSISNKLYWKGYTGTTMYPIVPFVNRHKRNPYPHSDVLATMSLQKELNVTRMHIMTHTANTSGITIAIPKGSGKVSDIENKLAKPGVRVIDYSPEDGGAPHFMYPPQLPSQLYESEKRFENTIYEQFGIYPFMGGGQNAHQTSSGILILDELSQRRIASKRSDIEESLNVLGKVVVELVQRHYTERKVIRLLQPTGRYNEIEINSPVYEQYSGRLLHRINDVSIGAYDLIVASGSTLPSNRMIRMEYFMKLYAQNLIDQYEVLKNVDEVDAEGVMERMGLLNQLQGQLEALSEEVKKLEGDLQTADREAVGARKRVEVEKFKAKLAQMQASIQTALNSGKERALAAMKQQTTSSDPNTAVPTALDDDLIQSIDTMV